MKYIGADAPNVGRICRVCVSPVERVDVQAPITKIKEQNCMVWLLKERKKVNRKKEATKNSNFFDIILTSNQANKQTSQSPNK